MTPGRAHESVRTTGPLSASDTGLLGVPELAILPLFPLVLPTVLFAETRRVRVIYTITVFGEQAAFFVMPTTLLRSATMENSLLQGSGEWEPSPETGSNMK